MYITAFITEHDFIRFRVIEKLPKLCDVIGNYYIADIKPVKIYKEQIYDNVYDYSFFKLVGINNFYENCIFQAFVCIRKDDDNETVNE